MSVECSFKWSTLVTGQKQGTVYFPSASSCQRQLQTLQSVSVHRHYLNVSDQFSAPGLFTSRERTPLFPNGKIGEWDTMGPDFSEKGKIACPCRAPNRGSSIIRTTLFRRSFKYRSLLNCLLGSYIILGGHTTANI
jgi:hypothetical protein